MTERILAYSNRGALGNSNATLAFLSFCLDRLCLEVHFVQQELEFHNGKLLFAVAQHLQAPVSSTLR